MAFNQTNTTSAIGLTLAKPLGAGLLGAGAALVYGFPMRDAAMCGAGVAGSAVIGEAVGGYILPEVAHLKGTAKTMTQMMLEPAITGGAFVFIKPYTTTRPLRIAGQSEMVSSFIVGAASDAGGNYMVLPLESLLNKSS